MTEKAVLQIKLTLNIEETVTLAFTYDRPFHTSQRHWKLSMKQSHLGNCSNEKLRTSTLVNEGTLRSKADFVSALINVNNVKIYDLLEFFVMLLFYSLCSHLKNICGGGVQKHFLKTSIREILF